MSGLHHALISRLPSTGNHVPPAPQDGVVFRPAPSPIEGIEDLKHELNFLVLHYLSSREEWKNVATSFCQVLETTKELPKRLTWEGCVDASYTALAEKYRDLPHSHLLLLLCEILKMRQEQRLQQIPPHLHYKVAPVSTFLAPLDTLWQPVSRIPATRLLQQPVLPSGSARSNYADVVHVRQLGLRVSSRAVRAPVLYQRFKKLKNLRGHMSAVYCVLFDRSGRRVITGSDDKLVKVWSTETGFLVATLKGHEGDITDMAVNVQNTYLATASNDNFIRIWSLVDFSAKAVLIGHQDGITSLGFAPYMSAKGEAMLVSTSMDGTIRMWPVSKFEQPTVEALVIDGRGSDSDFRTAGEPADSISAGAEAVAAANPSAAPAAAGGAYNILCGGFSRNGTHYVIGGSDNIVRVWNIQPLLNNHKRQQPDILRGHTGSIISVQFAHTQDAILSGSMDGTARIWRYDPNAPREGTGKSAGSAWRDLVLHVKRTLTGARRQAPVRLTFATWSLTDTYALTADSEGTIKLWDPRSGEMVRAMSEHQRDVYTIECHPQDPNVVLSAGYDTAVCLWDLSTGSCISKFFTENSLVDGKWSGNGLWFATSDDQGTMTLFGTGDKAPYDAAPQEQFFPWDFASVLQDANHYVIDERTQHPHYLLPRTVICDVLGRPHSIAPPTVATAQLSDVELARERQRLIDMSMQAFGEDWPMYRRRRRTTMASDDEEDAEEERRARARARREQSRRNRNRGAEVRPAPARSRGSDSEFSDDDDSEEQEDDSHAEEYADERSVSRRARTRTSRNLSDDEHGVLATTRSTTISERTRRHLARAGTSAEAEEELEVEEESSKSEFEDFEEDEPKKQADDLPPLPPPQWSTITEQVPNYYIPQVGDIVIYFRSGHRMLLQVQLHAGAERIESKLLPKQYDGAQFRVDWIEFKMQQARSTRMQQRARGFALVSLVPLPMQATAPTLEVTLYDKAETPDFLVLQSRFMAATDGRFKEGTRVSMWYPHESKSYHATVLQNKFPSPIRPYVYDTRLVRAWDSLHIQWDTEAAEHVNPWEVEEEKDSPTTSSSAGTQTSVEPVLAPTSIPLSTSATPAPAASVSNEKPRSSAPIEALSLEDTQILARLVETTMQLDVSEPFRQPVDITQVRSYCEEVSYPVDLGTILQRVKNRYYRRLNSLLFEVDLMLRNCERFNGPESPYTASCMQVRNHLLAQIQQTDCFISRRAGNATLLTVENLELIEETFSDVDVGGPEHPLPQQLVFGDDEFEPIPDVEEEEEESSLAEKKRTKSDRIVTSEDDAPPTSRTKTRVNKNEPLALGRLRSGRGGPPEPVSRSSRAAKSAALNTIAEVISDDVDVEAPALPEELLPPARPALEEAVSAPAAATSRTETPSPPSTKPARSRNRNAPSKRKRTKQDSEDEAEFVGSDHDAEEFALSSSDADSIDLIQRANSEESDQGGSSDFDGGSSSRPSRKSTAQRNRSRRKQQKRSGSPLEERQLRANKSRPNYRAMDEPEPLSLDELRKVRKQPTSSPLKVTRTRSAAASAAPVAVTSALPPLPSHSGDAPFNLSTGTSNKKGLRIRIKKS